MGPLVSALFTSVFAVFRTRAALQLEILALRHQPGVLQRSVKRPQLTPADRFLWAGLCAVWNEWRSSLFLVKASTVIGWHRKGFRLFWTWKVRSGKPGRPAVPQEIRALIRMLSRENPLWGAPRIHGELLKLGIDVSETSVSKYLLRHRKPPSQTWRTFLDNHVKSMVSVDFFTVPTIRFQILYVFLVLAHQRRPAPSLRTAGGLSVTSSFTLQEKIAFLCGASTRPAGVPRWSSAALYNERGVTMPRVDVRTFPDPLLFRLHLVAQELLQEEDGMEQTNWAHVVRVTRGEIFRRGFSSRDLQWLGAADQEGRERVLRAFRAERDQKRKHQRN